MGVVLTHLTGLCLLGEFPLFKTDTQTSTCSLCQLEAVAHAAGQQKATCTKRLANLFHMVCHYSVQMEIVLSHTWLHT